MALVVALYIATGVIVFACGAAIVILLWQMGTKFFRESVRTPEKETDYVDAEFTEIPDNDGEAPPKKDSKGVDITI